jgi:hypothetical protein
MFPVCSQHEDDKPRRREAAVSRMGYEKAVKIYT